MDRNAEDAGDINPLTLGRCANVYRAVGKAVLYGMASCQAMGTLGNVERLPTGATTRLTSTDHKRCTQSDSRPETVATYIATDVPIMNGARRTTIAEPFNTPQNGIAVPAL